MGETALYVEADPQKALRDEATLGDRGYYAVASNGTLWVLNGEQEVCRGILSGHPDYAPVERAE